MHVKLFAAAPALVAGIALDRTGLSASEAAEPGGSAGTEAAGEASSEPAPETSRVVDCGEVPLAVCEGDEPVRIEAIVGEAFEVGSLEVTVTDVEVGVEELPARRMGTHLEGYDMDWREDAQYPPYGGFVGARLTAKNIGLAPASFSIDDYSYMCDRGSCEFSSYPFYQEDPSDDQQPDATAGGVLVWDVGESVADVRMLIQRDAYLDATVVPVVVDVR